MFHIRKHSYLSAFGAQLSCYVKIWQPRGTRANRTVYSTSPRADRRTRGLSRALRFLRSQMESWNRPIKMDSIVKHQYHRIDSPSVYRNLISGRKRNVYLGENIHRGSLMRGTTRPSLQNNENISKGQSQKKKKKTKTNKQKNYIRKNTDAVILLMCFCMFRLTDGSV